MMTTRRLGASLAFLAAAALPVAAHGAELRGRITGDGGKPLAHAVVRLLPEPPSRPKPPKPARVETGDDGAFVASGLTGESFRVRVEAKGYAPLTQPDIPAGASVELRLRRGVSLSGILKDRAQGTPVDAATVFAWEKAAEPFGDEAYRRAKSGKDGRFVVGDLPEGKVAVEVRASGRAPSKSGSVALPKADFEVLLDPAGGLTGLVSDTAGDPVSGAEVTASSNGASGVKRRSATTTPDGRYRIGEARAEDLSRMTVRAPKFLLAERDGPAPADGVVDFVIEHGGSIAGTVRGFDGKAPKSFRVSLRTATSGSTRETSEHTFDDPTGAFRVDDLEPGTYSIEIAAERYADGEKAEVEVFAEQVADAGTLTLLSRSMLRGRVVDARDRAPVPGAAIRITLVDGPSPSDLTAETSWTATSAPDGTFTTPSLPDGTFDLVLEHPRFAPARTRVSFRPGADPAEVIVEMSQGGALTGTVLAKDLEPVAGARIVATESSSGDSRVADTGSDGHYYMDGLTPGTWTVTRQQEGQTGPGPVDTKLAAIRDGETTTVDFDEKPKISVSGIVLKGDTPIPNTALYFVATDNKIPRGGNSTRSDGEGRFQIGLLRGGRYQVSVVFGSSGVANGHSVVTLQIPEQPEVHQDIVFKAQAITGHVLDPDRNGVKGALVTAVRQGTLPGDIPGQSTTISLDGGAFRLDALDSGTYRVIARAKAYASAEEFPVVVAENEPEPDLLLTLQRGWIMRGRLVDPQGRGVPGALVVVAPAGAAESGYLPSQTDATGGFRITAPADGPANVAAITARFAPAVQFDVEQPADAGSSEVVLRATAGGTMRVRVVRRGGEPVAGVQVAYQPIPLFPGSDVFVDRNRPKPTAGDGTTLVTLLYPGMYVVSIPGRRDTPAIQVYVNEGGESPAELEVP